MAPFRMIPLTTAPPSAVFGSCREGRSWAIRVRLRSTRSPHAPRAACTMRTLCPGETRGSISLRSSRVRRLRLGREFDDRDDIPPERTEAENHGRTEPDPDQGGGIEHGGDVVDRHGVIPGLAVEQAEERLGGHPSWLR